jgi:hypothetical protein
MNIITERKQGRPGAKHFRTEVKHVRQKEYTMIVAIGEFLDFPILNAKNIDIIITFKPYTDNKKILQIQIRDDIITGFQNLSENNDKNPFNFGYNSSSHDNDESISEFGAGLKEAFIALSDKITIYTKSDDQYYKILFNIEKMSKIEDVNESFNYDEKIITQQEYIEEHKLQCGSSIILEEMVDGIIIDLDELKKSIINTYGKIIKERNIVVKLNGEQLIDSNISPFDNVYCKPFNSITKLYAKKNETTNTEEYYMIEEKEKEKPIYYLYNHNDNNDKKWSKVKTKREITKLETYKNLYPECLLDGTQINQIMTLKGTERQFCKDNDKKCVNGGDIKFYKRGRQHGSYSAPTSNGACNNVFLELEIYSKKIGKELGMTVNKLIKLNKENKLCIVVKEAIKHLQSNHAYDSSNATAERKYNILKETKISMDHVTIPTKLKEKLDTAAKKTEEEARLAVAEKARLAAAEKARLAAEEEARLAAAKKAEEEARLAAAEKARLEEAKKLKAAEKIQRTHRAKAGKVERLAAEKARLAAEKLKAAKAEAEEKARLEKARLEKARLEAAIKIQRIHRAINQKRQLIKKPEPKPKPKPEPILVDRFRRGSVEGKKFKEVITYYINQFGDNEDVCGEDLAMYNKVCKKLNIIP